MGGPSGIADFSIGTRKAGVRVFVSAAARGRRSSLISIQHAELMHAQYSLVGAVLCLARNHGFEALF